MFDSCFGTMYEITSYDRPYTYVKKGEKCNNEKRTKYICNWLYVGEKKKDEREKIPPLLNVDFADRQTQ